MIELLALDLDGTLIDEHMTLSDRVRQAVTHVQERGVTVTLATGRMLEATLPFALELGIDAPLICYQGALVQAPQAEKPLHRSRMEEEIVRNALTWGIERGWHAVLYANNALFIAEKRHPESYYRDLLGANIHWVDDLMQVLDHHKPVKFLFVADSAEADEIEAAMRQRFGGRMEIVRSHQSFVEGNPLGVSKGRALQLLAEHLDVPRERVMAVGDQGNDVSMLAWAGVGVAMGNGSPSAKAAADWIAPPFSEDGAAVAIQRFILTS